MPALAVYPPQAKACGYQFPLSPPQSPLSYKGLSPINLSLGYLFILPLIKGIIRLRSGAVPLGGRSGL